MWNSTWRERAWSELRQPWDILVIGGGITGAGITREATRLGLRVLLVEQRDFAWGTSSRSSKLVHGGLRYLKHGQIGVTRDCVHERERLLHDAPGLVEPLGFLLAHFDDDHTPAWAYRAGLALYDGMARRWAHHSYRAGDFTMLAPHLDAGSLQGGFGFGDAQTDDARLVMRLLREAAAEGAVVLNYVSAVALVLEQGVVRGARLRDEGTGRETTIRAGVTINATGVWADHIRRQVGRSAALRPLRGSHLVLPGWRVPIAQAISFAHPLDGRPVMLIPWEGAVLVGTTDFDHDAILDQEPRISPEEVAYLMAALESRFPELDLRLDDIISTYAGVRPVLDSGARDPSAESRDHAIWNEHGLLTVTGGKLTTFRLVARQALHAARRVEKALPAPHGDAPAFDPVESMPVTRLEAGAVRRLLGRYGADTPLLLAAAHDGELECVPGTPTLWAELRWAARAEGVAHLDDLLLRRVRIGLLLPDGGAAQLERVRSICQGELGWDDERWHQEAHAYTTLWQSAYSLPERSTIPDWHAQLAAAPPAKQPRTHMRARLGVALAGGLAGLGVAVAIARRRHAFNA